MGLEAPVFQLIPKVGGRSRSRDEGGVGLGLRLLDIDSDTSRMPSEAQRGLGRRLCLARPQGRAVGGRESDLFYLHDVKAFFLDKKKKKRKGRN